MVNVRFGKSVISQTGVVHGIDIKSGHIDVAEQDDDEGDDENYEPGRNVFVLLDVLDTIPGHEIAGKRRYQNSEQANGKGNW